ncbi:hypothetical protein UCDDA912_g05791 [Diaporthe ampelina]|uniref:Uncharacterized protein n=1 Tax=Diaporthe ampelina TaxID=1214573 RepID=A0A0G2HGK4_9PEZI|nr:hypothetical protein UCDDA912_g05791 [Diaporthe ampelina]
MVRNELSVRECATQAQQSRPGEAYDPLHVVTPGQWQQDLSGPLPFGSGLDVYSSQFSPYPTFPVYASHLGAGGSQLPAPAQDASSEGAAQPAAPQHAHTTFPYGATTMLDPSGRPCSAAEGSAQRSSGQSSHSRDSGGRTQGTLDTQYTLDAALDPRPGGAAPCDGGHCSCSTSPGGIPGGRSTMPGEGSSDDQNLYGIGTNPFMRKECHDGGSNSDEDLAHFRTLQ